MNITIVNPSQIPNEDKVFIEKNLEFLTPSDVAELMDISIDNARLLFHRDDFPNISEKTSSSFKLDTVRQL